MPKKAKSNPFKLALAARRGDLPVEALPPAAKLLYRDTTMTQDRLKGYASGSTEPRPTQIPQRVHQSFKRS